MEKQTAGRNQLGEFAPKFAQLNDDVLFGEVWSREDKLSLKNRCMITIAGLIGKGMLDNSFKYHLMNAKKHGITKEEMAEIITHLAFYCGWPNAWAAFNMAKEVYVEDEETKEEHGGMFGLGKSSIFIANVTFEPGCRNNWHIHHSTKDGGQILICVDGEGWYQEEGKPAQSLKEGDVVVIPANVKHWHGAKKNSWFSHLALEVPGENTSNEWCEKVTDEEYDKLPE